VSRKAQFHPQAFGTGTLQLIFPRCLAFMTLALLAWPLAPNQGRAQTAEPMQAGEAFLTRFSGTKLEVDGSQRRTVIDLDGTVGGIIDLRSPRAAPQGQHWPNVTQRAAVTARQVGQVFGIAIDDASPPNIYLAATAAFGLHRRSDNSDWLAGMWGAGGGPGTVYRLNAQNGYVPEVFAEIKIGGRANSGVALGNIAFDPWNRQLYVSDLETGMIHRLSVSDGADLGHYDHGIDGRTAFTDAVTGDTNSLPFVAFNPKGLARTDDCPAGEFATHPQCWNYADFRRRVWGLAVRRDPASGTVRLYYALWSSQGFSNPAFAAADRDDTRNSVWSVRIDEEGAFDVSDVRREFFIPQFFVEEADIARAGASHPVADIAFPKTVEQSVMLLAERGGARNLGLDARTPFAYPHEARVLRYVLAVEGVWQPAGRYDVGFYDRERLGQPYLRANAAGGVDFGFGYSEEGKIDQSVPSEFVWMTGDALCSAEAPCFDIASGQRSEHADVHGIQGLPIDKIDAVAPAEALKPYPAQDEPYPPQGPANAFMIDADGEIARNDATKIGDVEVYQFYPAVVVATGGAAWGVPDDSSQASWWPGPAAGAGGVGQATQGLDLAVQKAIPAQCQPGALCDFVIVVTNTGTLPFTAPIKIVDELANGWSLTGFGPAGSQWKCLQTGTQLACTHPAPELLPGQSGAVTVSLMVPAAQVPGQWENCAVLDFGAGGDSNPANDQGCATLEFGPGMPSGGGFVEGPADQRDLAISKVADSAECLAGEPCSFTISVSNLGQVKYDGVFRFVDIMPAGWSFGGADQGWWCILTAGGGTRFSCWRDLALDPGQTQNLTVTLVSAAGTQPGPAENCSEIDWSQTEKDSNSSNDRACTKVNVTPSAAAAAPGQPTGFGIVQGPQGVGYELAIDKGAPQAGLAAAPGAGAIHVCAPQQPCPFSVTITNMGVEKFDGPVRFKDAAPPGWSFADISSGWSCAPASSRNFSCAGNLSLDPGQSVSLQLSLNPTAGVPLQPVQEQNCVEIDWSAGKKDSNSGNDRACVPVIFAASASALPDARVPIQVEGPDISIRKQGSKFCMPGEECQFIIVIEGSQDTPFTEPFEVGDVPPKGWSFAGGSNLGLWSCKTDKGGYATACTYDIAKNPAMPAAGLTSADHVGFGIHFYVPSNYPLGMVKNCVIVTFQPPETGEIRRESKVVCAEVEIANRPKITMTKRFDKSICLPGEECGFSITIKNEGKGPYTGFLPLWDYTPTVVKSQGLIVESVSAKDWNCSTKFSTLENDFICYKHNLQTGEVVTITAKAKMTADVAVSQIENCAYLSLNGSDPSELSDPKRVQLVREFLEHKGYQIDPGDDVLSEAEKKALADYKTKHPIFKDAQGNPDISGEITDDLLKVLLPRIADASGRSTLEACDTVQVDQAGLIITKKGSPAEDFPTQFSAAKTADAENCAGNHVCSFTITVKGSTDAPFTGPIVIEDSSPSNWWALASFSGAGWSCTGTTKFVCTHPPANLTKSKSLELKLVMHAELSFYQSKQAQEEKHPWIYNCARIRYQSAAQYQFQKREEYESCYRVRLNGSDRVVFGYDATGTGSCLPPNCSVYDFTATLRTLPPGPPARGAAVAADYSPIGIGSCMPPDCESVAAAGPAGARYAGPLSMKITPPTGSSFPAARIIRSAPLCPASAWSCTRSGPEFGGVVTCRADDCALVSEEQVTVRIEGNIATDLKEPPPAEQTREVCGELAYQPLSRPGSIEQKVGLEMKTACVTTRILARPAALGDLQVSTAPQGRCAVGETCSVVNTIANVGGRSFATPTNFQLQGRLSPPVSIAGLRGERAGWSCRITGTGSYTCVRAPSALAAGGSERVRFDLVIPRTFRDTQLTHSVQFVWPGAGDTNLANDRAQFTIPVAAPGVPPVQAVPPPAPLPPKPVLPKAAPPQVVCTGGSIVRGICICPSGMTREQTGPNAFRCVAPAKKPQPVQPMPVLPKAAPPQVVCTGGSVVRGICICPSGMTREQTGPNAFRCVAPAKKPQPVQPMPVLPKAAPPQIVCTGGSVVRGICICPSGTAREQTGPNAFRCTPLKFQMIPGQIVCPPKTKLMNGKCVPIIQ
jgi:uncharacterized repeat protein (TIGR01451 family)